MTDKRSRMFQAISGEGLRDFPLFEGDGLGYFSCGRCGRSISEDTGELMDPQPAEPNPRMWPETNLWRWVTQPGGLRRPAGYEHCCCDQMPRVTLQRAYVDD